MVTFVSGILILFPGFFGLATIALLIILVLLILVPVFYGLKMWIQILAAEEITFREVQISRCEY